jgi:hypothetical protein
MWRIAGTVGAALLVATSVLSGVTTARAQVDGAPSDVITLEAQGRVTSDSDGDNPPAVDDQGGSGTMSFSTLACALVSVDVPPESAVCSASASLDYVTVVCGTWSGHLNASVTSVAESGTLSLDVRIVANVAVFQGDWSYTSGGEAGDEPVLGVGQVAESSPPSPDDPSDCTTTVSMVATLYAYEPIE